MAIIYGKSGAEKDLLWKCPSEIRKFGDIKSSLTSLRNELTCQRTNFFENLPRVVAEERDWLENLKREEKEIQNVWDEIIGAIKKSIEDKKIRISKEFKIYLLFTLPLNYLDLFIKMNIYKHHALRKVRGNIKSHNNKVYLFENKSEQVFQSGQKELISGISRIGKIIHSPEYKGAYGEISALNELKKLGDDYRIFSDVKITLPDYVRYNGNRNPNLKSAQMDFVVVGPTGIFVIEVKNWSSAYRDNHEGFSPHEQTDRAGWVLHIYLKEHTSLLKPKITELLVPIQRNLHYDENYKHVFVRDPPNVRAFIENKKQSFQVRELNEVIALLEALVSSEDVLYRQCSNL